jgi:hypothetical protein
MSTTDSRAYPRYLDWLRYISAFLLFGYGSSKIAHLQFHLNQTLASHPVASLTGYQLTWYYYGYSRIYACILGFTQVFGAILLFFRKTTLLGAITMFPVIVNILLIDVFILPPDYGPTLPAMIIFVSLVMILWRNLQPLLQTTWISQEPEPAASRRRHFWIRICIVATIVAMTAANVFISRR